MAMPEEDLPFYDAEESSTSVHAPAEQATDAQLGAAEAPTGGDGTTQHRAAAPRSDEATASQEEATQPSVADTQEVTQPSVADTQEVTQPSVSDSPEEHARKLEAAEGFKCQGNTLYGAHSYEEALEQYEEATAAAPADAHQQLAIYWANAAACHLQLDRAADCVLACSKALTFNPQYAKAAMRRSTAYEQLDELDKALKDAQQVLELKPGDVSATAAVKRLQPLVDARTEKLKEETLGKLKDLGNTLLGKFGLSLDNFAAEKDPNTGSYSIKFNN
jgi:tetratricopeptide (TPR) repeat protein